MFGQTKHCLKNNVKTNHLHTVKWRNQKCVVRHDVRLLSVVVFVKCFLRTRKGIKNKRTIHVRDDSVEMKKNFAYFDSCSASRKPSLHSYSLLIFIIDKSIKMVGNHRKSHSLVMDYRRGFPNENHKRPGSVLSYSPVHRRTRTFEHVLFPLFRQIAQHLKPDRNLQ